MANSFYFLLAFTLYEQLLSMRFRWLFGGRAQVAQTVARRLQRVYDEKLLPAERASSFNWFHSPELPTSHFSCKPMILTLGQYSTGKTTFIRHIIEQDYPGMRISQEPTTDRFVVIANGDQRIPGNALIYDKEFPFQSMGSFGNAFLSRFECAQVNSSALEGVTFIDTPGVLSSEATRNERGYDFEEVVAYLADRADMILFTFDASKLDISDGLKRCIQASQRNFNFDKVHIILNKADQLTAQQLLGSYGSLMWSLARVVRTPEAVRVFAGSFWDRPLKNTEFTSLFSREEQELYDAINKLPRSASLRKINDLARRARFVKAHLVLEGHIRMSKPRLAKQKWWKGEVARTLPEIYRLLSDEHNIPIGDFPDIDKMQSKIQEIDLKRLENLRRLDERKLKQIDELLSVDIPALLQLLPEEALYDAAVVPERPSRTSQTGQEAVVPEEASYDAAAVPEQPDVI